MLLFIVSIFFFAVAVAFAMIARKIWQFRTGRIIAGGYEEADWTDLSIESIRMRLSELAKFAIHHFVLLTLKIWIVTVSFVKRIDRKIRAWLVHILHRNGHHPAGGKPSKFLKNIRDHKDTVTSAIQKEGSEE